MEHSKTGTVEILQRVARTPMVSRTLNVGDIILNTWNKDSEDMAESISSYEVIGSQYIFQFIGERHFTVRQLSDYEMDPDSVVVTNPATISYLRKKSRKLIDTFLGECQEGILDD